VLIGGPPQAGKSVLSYSLKQALSQQGIECYLLQAAPDGEGDWFLQAAPQVAQAERRKGAYTPDWIEHMRRDIAYRPLPFLVDVGGRPTPRDQPIFDQCTHAILLGHDEGSLAEWQAMAERYNLILIGRLISRLEGQSILQARQPVVEGTISQLIRGQPGQGPVFAALLQRVQALFTYSADELLNIHWNQAPTDTIIDIPTMHRQIFPERSEVYWQPADLAQVFDYLPAAKALALYGRGPGWLYAAIAALVSPQHFYQFDARLGWVTPISFVAESAPHPDLKLVQALTEAYLHLELSLPDHYVEYEPQVRLSLPAPDQNRGVILAGKLPNWLYTSLTLYYQPVAAWVALYTPHLDRAIIVASRYSAGRYAVGQTVAMGSLEQ
jgi:CRISPR-associated protein Csx3